MSTTTNFNEWLEELELSYWGDIESLADAVSQVDEIGLFKCMQSPNGDRWFVKADDHDTTLMLASEIAKDAFMKAIDYKYCGGEGISGWCAYQRAMEKDD